MIDIVLEYIAKDWHTMKQIKAHHGISDSRHLRYQFEDYNSQYCPVERPRYIVSNTKKGYRLTTDTNLIKKSAEYHKALALNHLQKYWKIVKSHETKDNLILDIGATIK